MNVTEKELIRPVPASPGDGKRVAGPPVLTIISRRRGVLPVKELWEFRELLYFLGWRDIKVRYKQTAIGAAWAVLQPVITMVIFTAIFHRFARINTGNIPYPVFAFAGLLPWNLFAGAMQRSIVSLVTSAPMVTKVYFPRLIVPIAATFSAVVDFAIAFLVLIAMGIWYHILPGWRLVAMPLAVVISLLTAVAVGLWLSALNVKYRDVGHTIPFVIQIWMFASPVAYPLGLVPGRWHLLYSVNPMVGAIQLFRWSLLGGAAPDLRMLATSFLVTLALLIWGIFYFHRMERTFADVI